MARARNIKPSFFRNPDLADCSPYARLLFIGLWTMADREGRLEDRPRYIKFELLPSDSIDIEKELDALAARGFIIRYVNNGARYIQVVNFKKHQNPHVKEAPSTIPPPDEHGASTMQAPDMHHASPAESPLLIPDSGILKPETRLRANDAPDGASKRPDLTSIDGGKKPPSEQERRFTRFWAIYPKKRSKQDAWKAWQRIKPDNDLTERIIEAVKALSKTRDWQKENGQFIPYPATWLNAGGWEDEIATKPAGPKSFDIRDYTPAEWPALAYGPARTPEEQELSRQAAERLMG